jgi:CRISPR-associated endonuclease/helicase Cas3
MNILLISQCDKRALVESRRILDQFAERRGERTWQTPITQAGLDTLRKLLRKTARRNTAVACHWIRGHDHSELLWIVGDRRRFNAEGAVPTNSTTRNVLRGEDENDWHQLQLISALAALAALLHDLGKACSAFQQRLDGTLQGANLYRHEWVSLRLFQAFVGGRDDAGWLQRLIEQQHADARQRLAPWMDGLLRDGIDAAAAGNRPFSSLPPLARAVAWLILSHHRLPALPIRSEDGDLCAHGKRSGKINSIDLESPLASISADWNQPRGSASSATAVDYWQFPHGLPVSLDEWRRRAARCARRLQAALQAQPTRDWLQDPYLLHLARLSLMLADHHYSSLALDQDGTAVAARQPYLQDACPLLANTCKHKGSRIKNQTLDEHLLGVHAHAASSAHALPGLSHNLPRLQGHKGLRRRSANAAFRWQDRAADLAAGLRSQSAEQGAFIVNMASTGCGKTLGNARIMNALADPALGMRCAFAIGLRSLTLQTGRSFQHALELDQEALAILVGGGASRELFEFQQEQRGHGGSESREDALPPDSHVLFEGNDQDPILQRLGMHPGLRRLLLAPLLVCTVDHLMPATESLRGGHQIAPMLRLLSGDLVLDEPDDFDLDDLPALTRLVHWAGLLGARLLLSSATLPPALVEGLFLAYCDGRQWYQRNRGQRPEQSPAICCLWVDEFDQQHADCADAAGFGRAHQQFAARRQQRLGQQAVRRRAALLPVPAPGMSKQNRRHELAGVLREAALQLHASHHSCDPHSGKRVSFGLIRMAHIDPLVEMALALFALGAPQHTRIHLCVYHSQFPLFLRSAIEQRLDQVLDRRDENAVFELPEIRQRLQADPAPEHLFVVLGSPVTEVGRDHDYDWAIVEPSSMRSIIQLAGRVRRHRGGAVQQPNLLIWQRNLRAQENPGKPAYYRPGFEQENGVFQLHSHDLAQLLDGQLDAAGQAVIDARPRIYRDPARPLQASRSLVDLEHARLQAQMLPASRQRLAPPERRGRGRSTPQAVLNASSHWQRPEAWLVGLLQQCQAFREQRGQELELALLPTEDGDDYGLHRCEPGERRWQTRYVEIEQSQNHRVADEALRGSGITAWGEVDLMQAMTEQASAMDLPLEHFARKFAVTRLRCNMQGWWFHPLLGFSSMK